MKMAKKSLSVILMICMFLSLVVIPDNAQAAVSNITHINNPYETVNWETYGQYKADFHSHSNESDGGNTPAEMFEEHYAKGFDIQALTDHNFVNTTWDRTDRPAENVYLTPERLEEMNAGSDRDGRGLIGIPNSDEQSISDHLNTFWAPFNNEPGATLESNIAQCEALGGISHINHPGRYTGGKNTADNGAVGAAASSDPATVAEYVYLFENYSSCVGMEIINKKDGDSYSDRILWDNILKETMPSRPVWGFSNDDAHSTEAVGFSYNMMLMPENTLENVRSSMENGTFYAVALVAKRELGSDFTASGPAPKITNIAVDQQEDSISIEGENYNIIEWIADGQIIATGNEIDLNDYEDKISTYVRAQLKGDGGISFTQPFGIEAEVAPAPSTPKNVILLIGDGMGFEHMEAARDEQGSALYMDSVDDASGTMETWSYNKITEGDEITDSASAATAMATGYKILDNQLNVLPDEVSTPIPTIQQTAEIKGLATGVVTTTQIAHATPAAFGSAHNISRNDYEGIAAEMLSNDLEVLMGGARAHFDTRRADGVDLIAQAQADGYAFVEDVTALNSLDPGTEKILGIFHDDNGLVQERQNPPATQPHLNQMTAQALAALAQDTDGFFLMVEGGQIDWAAHDNDIDGVKGETLAFDLAVKEALDFQAQNPDTLIIVTADHETGGLTYDASTDTATWSSTDHTGVPVGVWAEGPGAELFEGAIDNTDIARNIAQLLDLPKQLVVQWDEANDEFKVTSLGIEVFGAEIKLDGQSVGTTDANGKLAYDGAIGTFEVTATKGGYWDADERNVTIESVSVGKPFAIETTGLLDRSNGIKATVTVNRTSASDHEGEEVVIFQLMAGNTPVSIVALQKDIQQAEKLIAHFNETGNEFWVKTFVFDEFNSDLGSVQNNLAEAQDLD